MGRLVTVARTQDVQPGQAIVVEVGDLRLALARVGNEFYAIDDVCSHDGGPLGEGQLYGHAIECPRHGARFDVRNGRVLSLPAPTPVDAYPVVVEDGEVKVELP